MQALQGLENTSSSVRLQAVMAIGTAPDPGYVDGLIGRCAVEPDFYVRDMLTWAITRHPAAVTVPRLVEQVRSANPRARSQALHTLSKVGDRAAWPAITRELLTDGDDEVARTAWRTAVVLVPEDEKPMLAEVLMSQLGRGDRATRLSLSRALIGLGATIVPALEAAKTSTDPHVAGHAVATRRLLDDPDAGFELAVDEAIRIVALGPDAQEK
ncbi:HEAT repeat domain-containing protein [Actinoplanes sichuanensis]|uniref:HEAT repeat domain-containing protein n=1 Tax=Actinoplanes sichuanensis TaxID=512349 RepID=A0ABW4A873_9ACTN|nr:HEAT repeat domain-containing protein [Actinoplanes sichuanensis]